MRGMWRRFFYGLVEVELDSGADTHAEVAGNVVMCCKRGDIIEAGVDLACGGRVANEKAGGV